jgi:hypothetical protein
VTALRADTARSECRPVSKWGDYEGNYCIDEYDTGVVDPHITIKYNVSVTNAATGQTISRNATVPYGTVIKYAFTPHVYRDVNWFAAARWYDSPYGDWVANGARPSGSLCQDKNYVDTYSSSEDFEEVYAALSVGPPAESFVINGGTCLAGGSGDGTYQTCTMDTPGVADAKFYFATTTGKMYMGETGIDGDYCYGGYTNIPLSYTDSPDGDTRWRTNGQPWILTIPTQVLDYPITVQAATSTGLNLPPAVSVISSNASCTVGQAFSFTMQSTDPNGDQIHYGVDWTGDGAIDQWFPPTGYVPSGTSQSASRTYSTSGLNTVFVTAFDFLGATSTPATYSFQCDMPPSCSNGLDSTQYPSCSCPSGQVQVGNICMVSACPNGLDSTQYPSCTCPAGYTQSGSSCVACTPSSYTCSTLKSSIDNCNNVTTCDQNQICSSGTCVACTPSSYTCSTLKSSIDNCNNVTTCDQNQICSSGVCVACTPSSYSCVGPNNVVDNCGNNTHCPQGSTCSAGVCGPVQCYPKYFCSGNDLYYQDQQCTNTKTQSCSWGCSAGQCLPQPEPTLKLSASPLLIQKGYPVTVTWSTTLVDSCIVTGSNGDLWTAVSAATTSSPLSGQTIFAAQCHATNGSILTKAITVNTIPIFCEPGAPGC